MPPEAEREEKKYPDFPLPPALQLPVGSFQGKSADKSPMMQSRAGEGQEMDLRAHKPQAGTSEGSYPSRTPARLLSSCCACLTRRTCCQYLALSNFLIVLIDGYKNESGCCNLHFSQLLVRGGRASLHILVNHSSLCFSETASS